MTISEKVIVQTETYGANNYHPLPIVISEAEGVWVQDPEGNKYMDMLAAYSAVNQGHRHPKIINALIEQANRVTLTSRAFHNDQLGPWYEMICGLAGKDMALPMNTGAEAVETAIKTARRWAYDVKAWQQTKQKSLHEGNFHDVQWQLFLYQILNINMIWTTLPGIKQVPYGDIKALKTITPNTAAFLELIKVKQASSFQQGYMKGT